MSGAAPAHRRDVAGAGPAPRFRDGLLGDLGAAAAEAGLRPGPCLLLTDRTVARHHAAMAARGLRRGGFRPRVLALPAGERHKTPQNAVRVLRALAALGAGRDTPLVALGGGVVTDLGGFAAAVYARGIPWVAVPTTVMGMADAAVGGKTAVDLPEGKNLAGAFHPAAAVLVDPRTLETLPARHVRNGLAEIAKMRLLPGVGRGLPAVRALAAWSGAPEVLRAAVEDAALAKHALVRRDPRETRGVRVLLNLGHTVGHALEAATGYDGTVLHGEAVATGLVAAARLAERRGLLAQGLAEALRDALDGLGLPTALPRGVTVAGLMSRIGVDKKRKGGTAIMVLPRTDAPAVTLPVAPGELRPVLESMARHRGAQRRDRPRTRAVPRTPVKRPG